MQYDDMKNIQIINKIIKIESDAQELVKNAKREQIELPIKISEILDTSKARYQKEATERINQVRIVEEELATEKIEQIYKTYEEKIEKLKKITDENIDFWIKKIYSFIIKPTEI